MKRLGFSGQLPLRVLDGSKTETRRIAGWPPRIRLPHDVVGDFPIGHDTVARAGVHQARSNPLGALSVVAENGRTLGIKPGEFELLCPHGSAGDRRAMTEPVYRDARGMARYRVDDSAITRDGNPAKWWPPKATRLPARYCPAWCSRATLELIEVRAERLQTITPAGVRAEGIRSQFLGDVRRLAAAALAPGALPLTEYLPEGSPFDWTQDDVDRAHFAMGWNRINGKRDGGATWEESPFVWVIRFRKVDA